MVTEPDIADIFALTPKIKTSSCVQAGRGVFVEAWRNINLLFTTKAVIQYNYLISRNADMKKFFSILLIVIMLSLSACKTQNPNSTSADTTETTTTKTSESYATDATTGTTEANPMYISQLPLPKENVEFSFLSGAGAWRTIITLNRDGTFTGSYLDSEMGESGEGYPHGSAYTCTFSGKFVNIESVNAYSYKMTLTDIKTEKAVGEEWIENEIRYVASEPHGLNDPITNQLCTEFVFYLPDTPVEQVPEEFLTWWPYRYSQESDAKTTLSCYGILNVTTEFGFFTTE